ncbi:MAG: SAM-dependent methyltransferase [candidate division Zixibacteria bacterium]|nr:SAM-dependent methyltransferase [candidate division Zixibacteria bacterium]
MSDPIKNSRIDPASFRDPSGFVFVRDGTVYRQVNKACQKDFDLLLGSGLYGKLVAARLLIPHVDAGLDAAQTADAYKVIKPDQVPFVSYPYEWCFGQLKDAASVTLQIQQMALEMGMSLKDASAYNIQFVNGRPVMIDTLSFEKYREGSPWVAYRQFCQHFLAPLALMSLTDIRLGQLLRVYIDGIPLDLASELLPFRTRFSFSLLTHIRLHARSQKRYADTSIKTISRKMSKRSLLGLIDNLQSAVRSLDWQPEDTTWGDYYEHTNYTPAALQHKKALVSQYLERLNPSRVWDLGANTGLYSRLAADRGIPTVAFDVDPAAVEKNYRECVKNKDTSLLPLLLDLTNPSPDLGWENTERKAALKRSTDDTVMALALVHHLAIANNLPLPMVAHFFARICRSLIIEFVPKSDSQTQRLLASREDIFPDYAREGFEKAFADVFQITDSQNIKESERTMYLMERK